MGSGLWVGGGSGTWGWVGIVNFFFRGGGRDGGMGLGRGGGVVGSGWMRTKN